MKKNPTLKPIALAIGATLATGLSGAALADSNPFGVNLLSAGYMVDSFGDAAPMAGAAPAAAPAAAEIGAHVHAKGEKIVEGKCGEGKCGEGKCGAADKGAHMHAKGEKIAEGKCGEGKCGEGKCGAKPKA